MKLTDKQKAQIASVDLEKVVGHVRLFLAREILEGMLNQEINGITTKDHADFWVERMEIEHLLGQRILAEAKEWSL